MSREIIFELTVKLLDSVYRTKGEDGYECQFDSGPSQNYPPTTRERVLLYFRQSKFIQVALELRKVGPIHYRYLSIDIVLNDFRDFLIKRYYELNTNFTFQSDDSSTSLLQNVSNDKLEWLAIELQQSNIFNPKPQTFYFPLRQIEILNSFHGTVFNFSSCSKLSKCPLVDKNNKSILQGDYFPPFQSLHKPKKVSGWLLIQAPRIEVAKKYRAAILGALALSILHYNRYSISIAAPIDGVAYIHKNRLKVSTSKPHLPSLSNLIIINKQDFGWLDSLDKLLLSSDKISKKKLISSIYFYKTWFQDKAERFATLCMTLESIFCDTGGKGVKLKGAINLMLDNKINIERLSLLINLRGAVIHGGAPDVYDSSKYGKYYWKYKNDPIDDLSMLVAKCMRNSIFNENIRIQNEIYIKRDGRLIKSDVTLPLEETLGIFSDLN